MKAIIVEDEQTGLENLLFKLKQNCPGVDVIATCSSGEDAIQQISTLHPQLVFLDINLGSMSGFDVLERLQHVNFEVIFTTAYDNFAIRAIKSSALDYLLKPFTEDELKTAVNKAWDTLRNSPAVKQIAVPADAGLRMLKCDEIVWCEADDNYSRIYLSNEGSNSLRVPRSLIDLYQKLPRQQFFRIHRSHVVNRNFVGEFNREGFVHLTNKKLLSVSKNYKDDFLNWLGV
jgi:two-component system LytT family response regulator